MLQKCFARDPSLKLNRIYILGMTWLSSINLLQAHARAIGEGGASMTCSSAVALNW